MRIWDVLLGSMTELDLLRAGEALAIGSPPRSAMGVLQALLRGSPRPPLSDLLGPLSEDTLRLVCARAGLALPRSGAEARAALLEADGAGDGEDWISVEAPRRQPRLAWQGMHTRPALTSVPVQVMEVVSPGLAARQDERQARLDGFGTPTARAEARAPTGRLIWTNDNLVALRTLLDERDPVTRDWRYRGKVDLVYIDPPFMVNNDFSADNSVSIDLDGAEGVSATKEPSLVEILAYKDTWREGLDSFLSMMRARLVLLKELLAPTGSIYVHLDWHAAHYVKVLMDEVFGYDRFIAQIDWKRATAHANSSASFASIVDAILVYGTTADTYWTPQFNPLDATLIKSHYSNIDAQTGRRYALRDLTAAMSRASESQLYEWRGMRPKSTRCWAYTKENMDQLFEQGRIQFESGSMPRLRLYLDDSKGNPLTNLWDDIPPVNSQAAERLNYPTQKPVALLERILRASCPEGGLVLDCFMGSGTTVEAAERLGRRWIGIDNGKYAVHLARKRLIQLDGQPRQAERERYDYVECDHCHNIERKARKQKSPGPFRVRPFSLESMGVYLRAEAWLDASGDASGAGWRAEMVRVFGGEPVTGFALLHGRDNRGWIHVGPLDAPVPIRQCWSIAREAAETERRHVTILSADLDTLPHPEREEITAKTGVHVTMRIIPRAAIDQVALRLKRGAAADGATESMAVPAFYTPLSIGIRASVDGPLVRLRLERCEVDIQSFLASQRPALRPITEGLSPALRKKLEAEHSRWEKRQRELEGWLARADTWQQFVDFWAVDWDYSDHLGLDGRPIFDTDWQSFRVRRGKGAPDPLVLVAETRYERAGRYQIAARVTDVFGNDGVAVVDVEVGR